MGVYVFDPDEPGGHRCDLPQPSDYTLGTFAICTDCDMVWEVASASRWAEVTGRRARRIRKMPLPFGSGTGGPSSA